MHCTVAAAARVWTALTQIDVLEGISYTLIVLCHCRIAVLSGCLPLKGGGGGGGGGG